MKKIIKQIATLILGLLLVPVGWLWLGLWLNWIFDPKKKMPIIFFGSEFILDPIEQMVGGFLFLLLAALIVSLILLIWEEFTFEEYINGLKKVPRMILRGILYFLDLLLFFVGLVLTHITILLIFILGMIDIISGREIDISFMFPPILISLIVLGLALYAIKSIYKIEGNLITIYLGSWKMGFEKIKQLDK